MPLRDLPLWLIACAFLVLTSTACNTRIEGCLDANAENFDLNGERACDGCCTYPAMQLSLTQKWNDENFSNTDTLYDNQGKPYQITDLRYFLTTWSWKDADGNVFTVDSVEGDCNESTLTFTPDILIVDTRHFLYTLGTIRVAPHLDSIYTTMGLTQDYSCLSDTSSLTPVAVTDQSPLWNPESGQLETIRLILKRSLTEDLLDTVFIDYKLGIALGYDYEMAKGTDTALSLTVDYAQWFADVNVDDLNSFTTSLLAHIPGTIIRTP